MPRCRCSAWERPRRLPRPAPGRVRADVLVSSTPVLTERLAIADDISAMLYVSRSSCSSNRWR